MFALENQLDNIEIYLSIITAIPGIGVIGGVGKIVLGTVQTVSALGITLIMGIGTIFGCEGCKSLCLRSAKHILHGLGNITAGIIESIPLIGSASGYLKFISGNSAHTAKPGFASYLAYGDLLDPRSVDFDEFLPQFDTKPLPIFRV